MKGAIKGKRDISKEEKELIHEFKMDLDAYEELRDGFRKREVNNQGFITRLDLIEILGGTASFACHNFMDYWCRNRVESDWDHQEENIWGFRVQRPKKSRASRRCQVLLDGLCSALHWRRRNVLKRRLLGCIYVIGADSKNGTVRKSDVIRIIQEEFQLPIDMEELFQKQNLESDDLNFESFCILFDSSNDDNMSLSRTVITVGLLNPQCYLLFNETIVYLFNRQEAQDSLGMKSFFSISSRFLSTFPSFFYLVWRLSYKMSFSFLLIGCFRLFYSLLFWFIWGGTLKETVSVWPLQGIKQGFFEEQKRLRQVHDEKPRFLLKCFNNGKPAKCIEFPKNSEGVEQLLYWSGGSNGGLVYFKASIIWLSIAPRPVGEPSESALAISGLITSPPCIT